MDAYILVSHDGTYGTRLIGVWDSYRDAKDAMDGYYEQAVEESGITEDERAYGCRSYDSFATVCPPHGSPLVTFRIFDAFNDAEINSDEPLHFF